MSAKKHKFAPLIIAVIIFIFGLTFRTFNLSWDNGYHLHPDERFLTMAITEIELPDNITEYFDTAKSKLNPYNHQGFSFFVYGTFPIFISKFLSHQIGYDTYDKFPLFGRYLSALFDSFNIILLFYLSKLVFKQKSRFDNSWVWLNMAGFIYAFTVLPLQLSHFFAVDTFLCFFLLLTFYFLAKWISCRKSVFVILSGISYGLAFSSKISSVIFFPIIFMLFFYFILNYQKKLKTIWLSFLFAIVAFSVFRVFQPYAFNGFVTINPQFIKNMKELDGILNNRDPYYPPEIQYLNKTPILYPLKTLIIWGFGLPLSLVLITSVPVYLIKNRPKNIELKNISPANTILLTSIIWVIFLIIYQGLQFTNTVRYLLPIYPFLCLILAYVFSQSPNQKWLWGTCLILHLLYYFAFLNIYTRPHSRYEATIWIYNNLQKGSKITNESWDDTLPLDMPGNYFSQFQNTMLPMYDPDTAEKWIKLNTIFASTDYLFMTSNRLWRSISNVPSRYPVSSKFYSDIFSGKTGYNRLITFNSYPGFRLPLLNGCWYLGFSDYPGVNNQIADFDSNCPIPGIYLRDDTAEESFTVYDHPQVNIFVRTK